MSERAPKIITTNMLLDALPMLSEIGAQTFNEIVAGKDTEYYERLQSEAQALAAEFFKHAGGKQNGVVLTAALFIGFRVVEEYRKMWTGIGEHTGSELIQ